MHTDCKRAWSTADVFPSSEEVEEDVDNLVMYLELRLGCSLENNASVIASDYIGLHLFHFELRAFVLNWALIAPDCA